MKLFYTLYWCLFFFSEVNVSVRKYTKVGLHPAIYRMSIVSPGISAPFEINESFATGFERVRVWFWISSILMDRRKLYPLSATPCRRYFVGRRFRVQPWKYNLFTVLFFFEVRCYSNNVWNQKTTWYHWIVPGGNRTEIGSVLSKNEVLKFFYVLKQVSENMIKISLCIRKSCLLLL